MNLQQTADSLTNLYIWKKKYRLELVLYLPDWWVLLRGFDLTEENNTNGCLSSPMSRSLAMGHMKLVFSSSHVFSLWPSPISTV